MDIAKMSLFHNTKKYNKVIFVSIFSIIIYIIAAVFNSIFVKIMPVESFLTWHTIFELSSILVSFSIFTVTYFIYEESGNLKMIMFGCAFLLMGLLDAFHTFSYKGMPYFFIANDTANRATILWIFSRLIGSLGFMAAVSIPSNFICYIKKEVFAIVTTFFTVLLFLIVTYNPTFFPSMYIEGEGLTNIKIFIEYFIIFILAITFIIIETQYRKTLSNNEYQFMIALVLLIFSEFSFTSYGSIYDAFNYIGHLYKIIAYSILYKTIYIGNVITPYKEMKKAKNKLKRYSDNLNVIVKQRTKELEKLNEVLLNDIEYAKEMQRCLLPNQMPGGMSVSFDAEYLAAEHLSGDFYNVIKLDEDNIAIYIGDVSGHGISAAMLSVFAYQNVLQLKENLTQKIIEPGLVLKTIYNSFNNTNITEEKYIVMLYGIYNIKDRSFNYSSAGINVSPYIIKKSGELYEMDVRGFPICKLGNLMDPYYENKSIQLETGDKILFYSDGLVEAKNKNKEVYGHHKLENLLKNNYNLNSTELNIAIKEDFFNHIDYSKELMDDITFLTMLITN
ncbi:MASE3 domain-containing protein [Tissierella creatinophila]|uniref:Phosphoserine phosphatase RsbU n=1 Tax=Tissierella creatinophila DSM 6911 TaxID=1123403 RepID=A0A1U7M9B1_TISCR|nr:MASE3 domain-containing protein [Tissierella creatinophila]OLS03830.1 phosphoserine phosphatase RsbU [Tissierella creatinophila DSM 6911]